MNYEILVKDNPGLCRCCLSEGCYKELATEYTWMNEHEVYADMLLECFDISITQHSEGPNGQNRLICEVCITRLRDACNFKKQVVDSEKKFIDMVAKGHFMPKVVVYEEDPVVKAEMTVEPVPGPSEEDVETEYLEEEMDFEDDEYKPDEDSMDNIEEEEDLTVSPLPVKGKKGKKRAAVVKTEKKTKVAKTKVEAKPSKSTVKDDGEEFSEEGREKKTKFKIRYHVREIMGNSDAAIPFRWVSRRFKCIFCPNYFFKWNEFVDHFNVNHDDIDLEEALKKAIYCYKPVCLDVNSMSCKYCSEEINDLNQFIDHLKEIHDCEYEDNYRDCFTPFKINDDDDATCAYCSTVFTEFHKLYQHVVDVHEQHRKTFCSICGQGSTGRGWLKDHMISAHYNTGVQCRHCSKTFTSYPRYRYHFLAEHKERNVKCSKCNETFCNNTRRRKHERVAHRISCYKCEVCDREFTANYELQYHKKIHLNQFDQHCSLCDKKFVSKRYLTMHMKTHSGVRAYRCGVCDKTFVTKKYLNVHEKLHKNDRRYVCHECGVAFFQTTSLKLHLKKHANNLI